MDSLKISVIIPNHNTDIATLSECLKAIQASSFKPFETILVDDASTINYPKNIERYCRIINNKKNMGAAYSRNMGAKIATGGILCFIDADVKIKQDTLNKIAKKFSNRDVAAVQTVYSKFTPVQNFVSQYQNLYHHYIFITINKKYHSALSSYAIAIRKNVFLKLKGFDGHLKGASTEDAQLGIALYAKGYKILLAKDINVEHINYFTVKSLLKRAFIMGRSRMDYLGKNLTIRTIKLSKTHHPMSFIASVLICQLIASLSIFAMFPIARVFLIAMVLIFLLINIKFFIYIHSNKGLWFMLKSIFIYYLVCLSIFLGCAKGVISHLKNEIRAIYQKKR